MNAILNYLYSVLESECRLAAAALGLDPGLGFVHMDARGRDSLACDLMEPIRPDVDAWVLDWITREPLKREWFFEQPNGTDHIPGTGRRWHILLASPPGHAIKLLFAGISERPVFTVGKTLWKDSRQALGDQIQIKGQICFAGPRSTSAKKSSLCWA